MQIQYRGFLQTTTRNFQTLGTARHWLKKVGQWNNPTLTIDGMGKSAFIQWHPPSVFSAVGSCVFAARTEHRNARSESVANVYSPASAIWMADILNGSEPAARITGSGDVENDIVRRIIISDAITDPEINSDAQLLEVVKPLLDANIAFQRKYVNDMDATMARQMAHEAGTLGAAVYIIKVLRHATKAPGISGQGVKVWNRD